VAVFIVRRLAVSFMILLAATFLMYLLVAFSGNPLDDLLSDPSPNKAEKIRARIALLHLDQSAPRRYLTWLGGVAQCVVPGGDCSFGKNIRSQDVSVLLFQAMGSTVRLVTAATVVAIVLGVSIGIISALRQYTGFDYTITFSAFLFFSLPLFWIAVLLKQYVAIGLNDWLADPAISVVSAVLLATVSALFWGALLGGDTRRRWTVRGVAFAGSLGLLLYLSAVDWFRRPALGPVLIIVLAGGAAVGITVLVSGLARRPVLYSALVMAGIGSVGQFALTPFLESRKWATWGTLLGLLVATIAVGLLVGYLLGGLDQGQAARAAVFTGVLTGGLIFLDVLLRAFPRYFRAKAGRVVATTGDQTPNFTGDFWTRMLDLGLHLILPTLAIMLISFATYSRYSRASMLEVMNQDYVRTARSKGLTERTVIMRHAFRNALIPITTLMAFDFGALLGGAVITENVFGWQGMGKLFVQGLLFTDPNPVMAFFLVTAIAVVVFNMIADIMYAYLDPRIRLG
jgi:peptide/nickel transport system permease protein